MTCKCSVYGVGRCHSCKKVVCPFGDCELPCSFSYTRKFSGGGLTWENLCWDCLCAAKRKCLKIGVEIIEDWS